MSSKAELFAGLATGQSPHTLFIACADSRVDPSLLTQTDPGELFVVRNAGNIVPELDADGSSADGTTASIEYAVAVLGVPHIVVCGHSGCGAMAGLADSDSLASLPSVARWVEHSGANPDGVDVDTLIQNNVIAQLETLGTYPSVRDARERNAIALHGWVYDIASGTVAAYDGDSFVDVLD